MLWKDEVSNTVLLQKMQTWHTNCWWGAVKGGTAVFS